MPRYHHGDLPAALIREATEAIRKGGPDAVSMRKIARRIGVSEAAPYHHFANRQDLIAAAAAAGFRALHHRYQAATEGEEDPRERLLRFAGAYVRFAIEEPGYFRVVFGAHVVDLDLPSNEETLRSGRAVKTAVTEDAQHWLDQHPEVDLTAEQLFVRLWSAIHGTAWLHVEKEIADTVHDDEHAVRIARELVDLVLNGLVRRA